MRTLLLPLLSGIFSLIGLFLSSWIVIPAPTFALLPLGVGAPEISPLLVVINGLAVFLSIRGLGSGWICRITLALGLLGLILSLVPLVQFPSTAAQASQSLEAALGKSYLSEIPAAQQAHLRPQPLVWQDWIRGIRSGEVRKRSGIRFAQPDGVPLTLEIHQPLQPGRYPTLIVIYGGAWRHGDPGQDAKFNRYMAAQGYTVIAVDYRHSPRYQFPIHLEDVRTALAHIQQHADDYDVDLDRIALVGRSAGAHLAMLAAYQASPLRIRAVVNYYGPVDLTAGYWDLPSPDPIDSRAVLLDFLGATPLEKPDLYRQASPITYITRPLPPSLLIYGGRDHLVQSKFGRGLYEQLQAVGSKAAFIEIPWAEHAFDAVFNGLSNQLALYHTERFLAWTLQASRSS